MHVVAFILAALLTACPAPAHHHRYHHGHGGKQIFCKVGYHLDRDGDRCIPGTGFPH